MLVLIWTNYFCNFSILFLWFVKNKIKDRFGQNCTSCECSWCIEVLLYSKCTILILVKMFFFSFLLFQVELHGLDGNGGPLYIGTGCFHRRDTLCGRKSSKGSRFEWKEMDKGRRGESVVELEERVKTLASSTFEKNTQWGHEVIFPSPSINSIWMQWVAWVHN